jgi:hypothetical protein
MKKRIVWLAMTAMAAVVVSCTHKPYHPEKSDRQWTIDHEACEKWVREGIRDEPDTYDQYDEMRLIRQCMKDKGWQWERTEWWRFGGKTPEAQ